MAETLRKIDNEDAPAQTYDLSLVERWLVLSYISGSKPTNFTDAVKKRVVWDALLAGDDWDKIAKKQPKVEDYDNVFKIEASPIVLAKLAEVAKEAASVGVMNGAQSMRLVALVLRIDPEAR